MKTTAEDRIKTARLSDRALDYAVALIELPHLVWGATIGLHHASNQIVIPELGEPDCYSPFLGGAADDIIDRERISTEIGHSGQWVAYMMYNLVDEKRHMVIGATRREAAMRCYVASKLGNEVEMPKDLIAQPRADKEAVSRPVVNLLLDFCASQSCEAHTGKKWVDANDEEKAFWRTEARTQVEEWASEAAYYATKQAGHESQPTCPPCL